MGPPPENCIHRFAHTLLGPAGDPALFETGCTVWLPAPEGKGRVDFARELLAQSGRASPADLRDLPDLPRGRWICVDLPPDQQVVDTSPADPLWCATVLGLCGPSLYAEDRTVIWTESRLSRRVTLYRPTHFHED